MLASKLEQSKVDQRLGDRATDRTNRFRIHQLGLRDAISGILIEPLRQSKELQIWEQPWRSHWEIVGDWFPFKISVGGFIFVLDDDGSIYVTTENLPADIREKAKAIATEIADVVYQVGPAIDQHIGWIREAITRHQARLTR